MLVAALSVKGQEFFYKANTARKVSRASGQKIVDIANECQFLFSAYPGHVWYLHEVDQYDVAFDFAQYQKFTIRNGIVKSVIR